MEIDKRDQRLVGQLLVHLQDHFGGWGARLPSPCIAALPNPIRKEVEDYVIDMCDKGARPGKGLSRIAAGERRRTPWRRDYFLDRSGRDK